MVVVMVLVIGVFMFARIANIRISSSDEVDTTMALVSSAMDLSRVNTRRDLAGDVVEALK